MRPAIPAWRSPAPPRRATLETGLADRAANMEAFAAAMLDAFLDALAEADRAPQAPPPPQGRAP